MRAGTLDLIQVHGVLLLAPHPREFEVTLPPHSGLSSLRFSGWWVLVGPAWLPMGANWVVQLTSLCNGLCICPFPAGGYTN